MGFNITEILKTETKLSASRLLEFLKEKTNEFFSKQMLMKAGFSSNITDQLKTLTGKKTIWALSTNDQTNPNNRKNVTHYAFVDEKVIPEAQLKELRYRCLMTDEAENEPVKKPKQKSSKKA